MLIRSPRRSQPYSATRYSRIALSVTPYSGLLGWGEIMAISWTLELSLWRASFVNWAAHINSENSRDSVVLSGLDGGKGMVWHCARTVQDAGEKPRRERKPRKIRVQT